MNTIFFNITLDEFIEQNKFIISPQKFSLVREREIETIYSMGNGYIGTRNSLEEFYPQSSAGTFVAGFYEKALDEEFNILVKMPDWTRIKICLEGEQLDLLQTETLNHRRYIDLNNGSVVREWQCTDNIGRITSIKIIKFISLANKHEMGKCIYIKPENYKGTVKVLSGIDCETGEFDFLINQNISIKKAASVLMKSKFCEKEFIQLQKSYFLNYSDILPQSLPEIAYKIINNFGGSYEEWQWLAEVGKTYCISSMVCTYTNMDTLNIKETAENHFSSSENNLFETCFENHTKKWLSRWKESQILISNNKSDQQYIDFAIYHLIISGEFSGDKYSIPARNLSGDAYKGHVFWDTEMYLLPFFTYTKPEIARKLLLYRYNTLDGARYHAENENFKGASFAWESTDSGKEMAPAYAILPNGNIIYILSGQYENHLSADIAYAVWKYWQATEDDEFIVNYGAEIVFETARFYESLLKIEADGFYHIPSVIGPDEYHEKIDDNAYTNYMADKNFEIALKIYDFMKNNFNEELIALQRKINLTNSEADNWKKYNNNIYTGFDAQTKLFEQFRGFYTLDYIDLQDFEPRSVPMDIILGNETIKQTQVIKQADVLMFLFLFGENFSDEIIQANYDFYEPRTGHGSSLSPSIHSVMAARLGKTEDAYNYFQKNIRIDIDDEFGNAAGGIHIASQGGTWLSAVMGFAGMQATDKGLIFNPHLPEFWETLSFSIKWRGQALDININKKELIFSVTGSKNIFVSLGKDNWKEFEANKKYFANFIQGKWHWKDRLL